MEIVLDKPEATTGRRVWTLQRVHTAERVALVYFCYLALLAYYRHLPVFHRTVLTALPAVLYGLWWLETETSKAWSRIVREWASLGLILIGYWSLQWFAAGEPSHWESVWVGWDRTLLDQAGLRHALESAGSAGPFLLETLYLLLYSIPPLALGLLYLCGARAKTNRFLLILFLGTFFAYALLPMIPVSSPRLAFAGSDEPGFRGWPRLINTYLLDHLDISTSVFPSGHVAVAFSSAFGLFSALRNRRTIWSLAFLVAALVYLATVYGRYHYAVDGLASFCIAILAWQVGERLACEDH